MVQDTLDPARLHTACEAVTARLLAERTPAGHWEGELSTSALSTATAVMALEQVRRNKADALRLSDEELSRLIAGGLRWLVEHQNPDGGWGDTTKSKSNISTTMLCRATLACASGSSVESRESKDGFDFAEPLGRASAYIDGAGGIPALIARYGKDKTFSVPILTHCALAGLVNWRSIPQLPFELAWLPARFYAAVRLPVVSYALPALIAIGQVRHHFAPTRNPVTRVLRSRAVSPTLDVLQRIQPTNGGFLEAAPLTSFVTMSLAGMGKADHPVAVKGVEFLVNSVRPDGSWPIDTNLATWVTTLSVNALGDDLPDEARQPILKWLLDQQYREIHPYTNAPPGGWAWTNLPGGVPDADDTPGAVLALLKLVSRESRSGRTPSVASVPLSVGRGVRGEGMSCGMPSVDAVDSRGSASVEVQSPGVNLLPSPPTPLPRERGGSSGSSESMSEPKSLGEPISAAIRWLLGLQNRDGGFPTFCRGWGTLPFDRSSPDITAHAIRSLIATYRSLPHGSNVSTSILMGELGAWGGNWHTPATMPHGFGFSIPKSIGRSFRFLRRVQRPDGSWLPLWFGNQHAPDDINPTYGTARVLAAFRDAGLGDDEATKHGVEWLLANQNDDGGWGGIKGTPSSVEETALAVEILCDLAGDSSGTVRGVQWLIQAVEDGSYLGPSPIGFYFAKLWYFERLYPLIFTVAALRAARDGLNRCAAPGHDGAALPNSCKT